MTLNSQYAVNDQIRAKEVRLIASSGEQVGIISTIEARRRAAEAGLDLVAINITDGVPVCKILDYGKFKYEQSRKDKENKAKARESRIEVKEVQLRPTTDSNDIMVKAKRAQRFLEDGDKVKIVMKFRGREITHVDVGVGVLQEFCNALSDFKFERPISRTGGQLFAIIAPAAKKAT